MAWRAEFNGQLDPFARGATATERTVELLSRRRYREGPCTLSILCQLKKAADAIHATQALFRSDRPNTTVDLVIWEPP